MIDVRSNGGAELEGKFEATERAAADLYCCALAVGMGVRAKVLELPAPGEATKQELTALWAKTPYPPFWSVVAKEGSRVALKVYDNVSDAETWAGYLTRTTGEPHWRYSWVHPEKPVVGQAYRETIEREAQS